jgi:hypothetical protein
MFYLSALKTAQLYIGGVTGLLIEKDVEDFSI